jgi:two-component system, chemotaxis family, CheB/CheR fusion protein
MTCNLGYFSALSVKTKATIVLGTGEINTTEDDLGTVKFKTSEDNHVPICGIGASAGGVKALQALFREIPDDLGLAYVVILHLAPDHPSAMEEILASASSMQVHQVQNSPELKTNCVYVIAPDRELVIEGDHVKARPFTQSRGSRAPIDMFFRSIAEARSDGLAVILTGAGSDGAGGAAAIKEAGGVIFVQDPAEAEFPSMPQSAIATGVADFIAPIAGLAERIVEVARSKATVRSLDADRSADDLRRIVTFLHARTGHDFSSYKRATVMRRVLRRMQVRGVHTLGEYATLLQETPEEANELFRDMLISVTRFFRNPEAFAVLAEQAIKPLFEELSPGEGLRCWVPGCATGEEAYSLAILIREEADRRKLTVPVQIFATDLDEGALMTARQGQYPRAIEADVSDERLRRFFVEEGSHYRIRKEIRETVLFASHSMLKDPQFLRLDLISCRNLLIYLERSLQEKVCAMFAYGLKPQRYLFLGSAESADAAPDLFDPVNREMRLFRVRPQVTGSLRILGQHFRPAIGSAQFTSRPISPERAAVLPAVAHLAALEQAAPPSVLIDDRHHILHLSPGAGKYILHSGGPFDGRLSSVVRPELRVDLSLAIDRALADKATSLSLAVPVDFDGETRLVATNVIPAQPAEGAPPQVLVVFLDGGTVEPGSGLGDDTETHGDEVRRLDAALKAAGQSLACSRHDHERSIEELRAANEELQSINEEYRSTAEELETSKEELQSMNEELQTVNAELQVKLKNISSTHSDLRNLTAATEIGTLFLDKQLHIRMFTPPIAALFNITENDVGRPLTDFTHRLKYNGIERDIRKVLRDLTPFETELERSDGRWLMMRLRPYRTIEDRIEGAVVSFVDISRRRAMEQVIIDSERRYHAIFDSIDQACCVIDLIFDDDGSPIDYRYIEINQAFAVLTGTAPGAGNTMREIEPDQDRRWLEAYGRVALSRHPGYFEGPTEVLGRKYEVYAFPFGDPEARLLGAMFRDITARQQAEIEHELLAQELSHRVKNTLAVVQGLANQTSRSTATLDQFRTAFIGRLQALAEAHGILLATQWKSADMHRLVERTLGAFGGGGNEAISVNGPAVLLKPKQGLGLSMVLHELCTNAAKYGALSVAEGRISLGWSVEQGQTGPFVRLRWEESGGPPVAPPQRMGFGTRLIERSSRHELGGTAHLAYDSAGLRAELLFPLN